MIDTTIIRLTQEATLEEKLAINKHSGIHRVVCCVCNVGITEDKKPIYYTEIQNEQLKQMYDGKESHGYCKKCYDIEKYKLYQGRSQR